MPRFSIVMPVYNAEAMVSSTLDALFAQTFANIEVIAVNDASTDDSAAILDRYSSEEPRLKVIHHAKNTYTGQARKDGVLAAEGNYILFVDQDDALTPNACERLAAIVQDCPVDIVHFGTQGVISGDVDRDYQATFDAFLRPYDGYLMGEEVLDACFFERKYSWNIWNKLYRADICKKAHSEMDMADIRYGEDFYAYFLMAFYSQSYLGLPSEDLYTYNYGSGQTGRSCVDLKLFDFTCTASIVVDKIQAFANVRMQPPKGAAYSEQVRSLLIWEPACMLKTNVAVGDKPKALRSFIHAWGADNAIGILRQLYDGEEYNLANDLLEGGGIGSLWKESEPAQGILLSSQAGSTVIWDIVGAKSQGLLCFAFPQFSLRDSAQAANGDRLALVPALCLCDAIAVRDEAEAVFWHALGIYAVLSFPEEEVSLENLFERYASFKEKQHTGRADQPSFSCEEGSRFIRALVIGQLHKDEQIRQLQTQSKQLSQETQQTRNAVAQLDAVLESSTWKAGSALTWLPRKIKDLFRSLRPR